MSSITVSIVSHGHGQDVAALLDQLAQLRNRQLRRVVVTANLPEADGPGAKRTGGWPFEVRKIDNAAPQGFGANHNQAFAEDARLGPSDYFAVLNPDVRLIDDPFPALVAALSQADAGCAYPVQIDADGKEQDHERALPSPTALLKRYGLSHHEVASGPPDWVNAAFLLFPRSLFERLGGFDTRYHMYCEDVDLCLRIRLAGRRLICASQARVVHRASRATRRSGRHLLWHVASLWRLWNSGSYRDFKRLSRAHAHS